MNERPELVLASYVTYKELYRCQMYKSPYQILGEFVKYILCENKIYQFSSSEMKKNIQETFGFKLPDAVLKSTLKKIDCVEKVQENGEYSVCYDVLKLDSLFE